MVAEASRVSIVAGSFENRYISFGKVVMLYFGHRAGALINWIMRCCCGPVAAMLHQHKKGSSKSEIHDEDEGKVSGTGLSSIIAADSLGRLSVIVVIGDCLSSCVFSEVRRAPVLLSSLKLLSGSLKF